MAMADLKIGFIRIVLYVSNAIFACTGVAILAMSAVIFKEMRVYSQVGDFMDVKYAGILITLMVVGSLVILVTLLGLYGTVRENQRVLMAFAVMLFVIYVSEIVLSTLSFLRSNDIEIGVKTAMSKSFENYRFNPKIFNAFNTMQRNLHCCGVNGPAEYVTIFLNASLPASCCYRYDGYMCRQSFNDHDVYQKGCFKAVQDFVARSGVILGSVTLSLAFSEVLAIVFALLLIILLYREEKKMGIHLNPAHKFEAVEMEPRESEWSALPEDKGASKPSTLHTEVLDFQPRVIQETTPSLEDVEVPKVRPQEIEVLDFRPQEIEVAPPEDVQIPKVRPQDVEVLDFRPQEIPPEDVQIPKVRPQDVEVLDCRPQEIPPEDVQIPKVQLLDTSL